MEVALIAVIAGVFGWIVSKAADKSRQAKSPQPVPEKLPDVPPVAPTPVPPTPTAEESK